MISTSSSPGSAHHSKPFSRSPCPQKQNNNQHFSAFLLFGARPGVAKLSGQLQRRRTTVHRQGFPYYSPNMHRQPCSARYHSMSDGHPTVASHSSAPLSRSHSTDTLDMSLASQRLVSWLPAACPELPSMNSCTVALSAKSTQEAAH